MIVMGMPGAGKSTLAQALVADGYHRLNRDEAGSTLRSLLPALGRAIESGATRIVLDNTYGTRKSRAEVIQAAATRGLPVRCEWLSTSLEEAQTNAVWRMVGRYGRLPSGDDLAELKRSDGAAFLPGAQFKFRRELEPPDASEGFSRVDVVPFVRRLDPAFAHRAVLVSCDDVGALEPLAPRLRPEISQGRGSAAAVTAMFAAEGARLGFEIDVECCPHPAGPPRCWCRKPLPGLARRLGFEFLETDP